MGYEERGDERYSVGVDASFSNGTRGACVVKVTNLSASGCRFASTGPRLRMGALLSMTFGRAGLLEAQVKWRVGNTHGVRFDQPLAPALLDHVRLFLSEEPALVAERDGVSAAA